MRSRLPWKPKVTLNCREQKKNKGPKQISLFAGMVTVSASANTFGVVSGDLEWEDLIILIPKPHKYPTVITMNVPRLWLSG